MLEAAEAARRRELQRRAYAAGGALTDAEAVELQELDARRSARSPGSAAQGDQAEQGAQAASGVERAQPAEPVEEPQSPEGASPAPRAGFQDEAVEEPHEHEQPASERRGLPRRLLIPVVAVIAVIVGLAAGSYVFGEHAPAMNAAQQEAWAKLEASGQYDPGSLRLVGSRYDVDAWRATRSESELDCLILSREGVVPSETGASTMGCINVKLDPEGVLQASLNYSDEQTEYSLWATVMKDIIGKPAVVIMRQDISEGFDWRQQFNAAELDDIRVLEGQGFDGENLDVVGYDGDIPVWVGHNQQTCVLVVLPDDAVARQCGGLAPQGPPLVLVVGGTTYSVQASADYGNLLTLYRTTGDPGVQG